MHASSNPPFDVVDAWGRRRRVHPTGDDDTVAHLASALGYREGFVTTIAGRAVAAGRLLTSVDELVEGVHVGFDDPTSTSSDATSRSAEETGHDLEFAVVTGPSCRHWTPLPVGRHGVGRSPHATIRLADDLVEIHHAVIDVDPDASIAVWQLTGRVPLSIARSDAVHSLVVGSSRIEIRRRDRGSASRARGTATVTPFASDPWRRQVRRGPAATRPEPMGGIAAPVAVAHIDMPSGTALVGAVVAVLGALAIAVPLRQTMFAVFALVGALASATTWCVAALGVVRRRRNARRASILDHDRFITEMQQRHESMLHDHRRLPDVVDTLAELDGDRSGLWHRRPDVSTDGAIDAAIEVVIGRGVRRVDPKVDQSADDAGATEVLARIDETALLRDVPVSIRLAAAEATAIRGDTARVRSLIRSVLVQMATWFGPADLRVIVVGDPAVWDWVRWLPHARPGGGPAELLSAADVDRLRDLANEMGGAASRMGATVLVIDEPSLLAVRTGPLRRFMDEVGATTIVAVEPTSSVPTVCRRTLALSRGGGAVWHGERDAANAFEQVCVAGIDEAMACHAARALAPLVDPEADDHVRTGLPDELTLAALDTVVTGSGVDDVVARWTAAGGDPALRAPIGASATGIVEIDLVADGPHALVAGTTGSGKSELLRTLVVSLAGRISPAHLNFVLIDYKGGATFDSCVDLPHTVGMVTDLDDGLAERALVSLGAELDRRERLLRTAHAVDLGAYRAHPDREPIARLVVIIDEFATLAHELPDFLAALVGIAQRGRSLGVHIILATQRPAGVITDDIRANTDLRVALRVSDPNESRDVVGDDLPSRFRKSAPGRAMLRLAGDERIVFQAARCTGPVTGRSGRLRVTNPTAADAAEVSAVPGETALDTAPTELDIAVDTIRRAAASLSIPPPRRPWLEPLPTTLDQRIVDSVVDDWRGADAVPGLTGGDVAPSHDAIGVVDDPRSQRRLPLRWDRTLGNLAIHGALGSGRTSAIVSLVAALCRTASPDRCHVYVIDGLGDRSLDGLASVAHCGAVVRVVETERIDRLLRRLDAEIEVRSTMTDGVDELPDIVLLVDGLGELRRSLDTIERMGSLVQLDRILEAGPAVGIASCLALDGGGKPASVPAAERWILRLDDDGTARALGVRGPLVSGDHPGRLRVASSGLEAQIAQGAAGLAALPSRPHPTGPSELYVLPTHVDVARLVPSHVSTESGRSVRRLVVALASDGLESTPLCVPDGDHIFVGGGARTGVTTALEQLAAAWSTCEPAGVVLRWGGAAAQLRARLADDRPLATLLVVDDADRVHDADGLFAEVLRGGHSNVTIAVGARLDAVRTAYGHWTRDVARSRCGFVMTGPGEIDGDLLGAVLPRRPTIAHRPGLAWLVDGQGHRLVQVAGRMPT